MYRLLARNPDHAVMPFGEHLEELRRRIIHAIVGLVPIFVVAAAFGKRLLNFLLAPAREELLARGVPDYLIETSFLETFGAYMRVALIVTVVVGAPWILWQLWLFVAPGLYAHERRFAYLLAPLSVVLTLASMAFLYFVMLPVVLSFFIGFSTGIGERHAPTAPLPPGVRLGAIATLDADPPDPEPGTWWVNRSLHQLRFAVPEGGGVAVLGTRLVRDTAIQQQYRISEYVKVFFNFTLALGVGFQVPVVVLLLNWIGMVDRAMLTRYRKHALFICAVLGAVLTPADPVSMIVLTVPLYALYEFGVLLTRFVTAERVARGFGGKADATKDAAKEDTAKEPADAGDQ